MRSVGAGCTGCSRWSCGAADATNATLEVPRRSARSWRQPTPMESRTFVRQTQHQMNTHTLMDVRLGRQLTGKVVQGQARSSIPAYGPSCSCSLRVFRVSKPLLPSQYQPSIAFGDRIDNRCKRLGLGAVSADVS